MHPRTHRDRGPIASRLAAVALLLALAACGRETSGPEATDEAPAAQAPADPATADPATAGEGDADARAYYAGLEERFGADYASCGQSERRRPGDCDEVGEHGAAAGAAHVLLMLDASGSMAGRVGGERKLDVAQDALLEFAGRLPEDALVGLRVYGHTGDNTAAGKAESCAGSELLSPFSTVRGSGLERAVRSFEPVGWTPIAASLDAAAGDFAAADATRAVVYVVSDGIETCDADPVEAARRLHGSQIDVIVNVIGFDVGASDARQLRAVAEAGGGEYLSASNRRELTRVFNARALDAYTRYVCSEREQNTAMIETSYKQHSRVLCLSRLAQGEYGSTSRAVFTDYREKRIDEATRDYALERAKRKSDEIVEASRQQRDDVLDEAGADRTQALRRERGDRDRRLEQAQRDREEGSER